MNKPNSRLLRGCLLALGSAGTLTSIDASAQTTTSGLEEIIVTAQRRELNLQTTSVSASVIGGDLLLDKGVTTLYDLQYAAPSVNIAGYGSANVFNIRGIGRSQVDIDVPSGVVIYRDGAPTLAGYFQNEPYFDIDSIEVYRGPQGTFVGKSAAGGAVFINTRDPDLDDFHGSVIGDVGNYASRDFTGIVNVPLGDTFRHARRPTSTTSAITSTTRSSAISRAVPAKSTTTAYRLGLSLGTWRQFQRDAEDRLQRPGFRRQPDDRVPGGAVRQHRAERRLHLHGRVHARGDGSAYETGGGLNLTRSPGYQDVDTRTTST